MGILQNSKWTSPGNIFRIIADFLTILECAGHQFQIGTSQNTINTLAICPLILNSGTKYHRCYNECAFVRFE